MAFATVEDLAARWRELDSDEEARAATLLDDAAVVLRSKIDIDPEDADQAARLALVSCNMVKRAMAGGDSLALGVSQETMTAGPYTQSFSYSNPSGDMYLTKSEKQMLGIGAGYIGSIRPMMEGEHDSWG